MNMLFLLIAMFVLAMLIQFGPSILNFIMRPLLNQRGSIGGRLAKVMYGATLIAGLGDWALSGFVPDVLEDTSFGDTVKKWKEAGIGDGGTFTFTGNYSPDDVNGQVAINALANTGTQLTNLYFYEDATHFWRVGAGGCLILKKFNAITMKKNALGAITFDGVVSGQVMERVGN